MRPRPRAPLLPTVIVFACVVVAAAFLAAGIPVACQSRPAPSASGAGATAPIPAIPYSIHTDRIREPSAADPSRMTGARVLRVVDGDTAVVEIPRPPAGLGTRETVRLIGVDAPELGRESRAADPGGPESAAAARALLEGRAVLLAFDRELRDRYDRVLAYLYSPDGVCLNLELVRSGAARALLKYPFAFSSAFAAAEREARSAGRGLHSELYIP